tara:strand:- start:12264 stop:15014 length:2751 start_codon:yes stop_codon:yes gene_type:complete
MIELLGIIPSWFIAVVFAATLVVNRAGASKIFFDVVGTFQANRLIMEGGAAFTTFQSLALDAFSGIEEAAMLASEQIQEMVDATVPLSREIAAARIEFDKFIDDAEQARLGNEIKDIGVQFGFTGDQALRAGAKMAQLSGMLGEEAVPAATEMSLAFGMIGEMEAEQAMQRLINLHQQTGFMMRGTTQAQFDAMSADEQRNQIRKASIATLNELNAVEDHSAANMERITFVMNQFASQAHLTGESIAEMAAMSAVLIEAGEEQGKAGRALRMIYARLGADTNGAATELEKLGIATKKADGTLRPLNEILIDLDNSTINLSKAERQRIAQTVAGNNHYVRMLKLMEGTERMQTLMGEATGNTAPIVDILNDRFADMSVRLTQAETALHNVRGEIGDALLPAVVKATEKQVEFNEAYLDFIQMPVVGDLIQGMTQFQQMMSTTLGPLMQMNLNFKQMSLGLMTTVVVMRALNGEAVAGFNKEEHLNNLRREGKMLLEQSKQIKAEGNNLTRLGLFLEEEEARIKRENIALARYAKDFSGQKLAADKARIPVAKQQLQSLREEISLDDIKLEKIKEKTINHKNLNILTKDERADKTATILLLEQEIPMLQQAVRIKTAGNHVSKQEFETGKKIIFNLKMQNDEIEKFNFQHLMKVSSGFMMMQMGAMAATMAVGPLTDVLNHFGADVDASRVQMIMMAMVMGLTVAEMGIFTAASTSAGVASTGAAGGTGLFASAMQALSASTMTATTALKAFGKTTIVGLGLTLAAVGIAKLLDMFGLFGDEMDDFESDMEDFNTRMQESARAAEALMDAQTAEMQSVMNLSGAYGDATDEIQRFGSAREELFFGFKAGNVTGDLVKQVQQQGVENFVAHTEVIQTNNFNGVTTDDIANQILEIMAQALMESGIPPAMVVGAAAGARL